MADASADWVTPERGDMQGRYTLEIEKLDNGPGHWNYQLCKVLRVDPVTGVADGQAGAVGEFKYRYSGRPPFEPFRQLRDGVWHDYALCAEDYTRLSVMDLETGKIIAVEEPTAESVARAQELIDKAKAEGRPGYEKYTAEGMARGWGFCPVGFMVPDFWEHNDGSIMPGSKYWDEGEERLRGDWGVYCGCVWGDDNGWKLRYVDLSRVAEGVVTTDDRFGYLPVWGSGADLRKHVTYYEDGDTVVVATEIWFSRETGKASHWTRDGINWSEEKTDE